MLRDLEPDALISRGPDSRDPRRDAVDIPPAGRKALTQRDAALDTAHTALLTSLSAAERRQLDRLLQRLVEHHVGAPERRASKRFG
ncbi:MAG: hypothetical protein HZB46_00620 [Solirubrobacterales bacterium]|nr:hypothetical protein [Solirubrobacterales bacterium]